MSDDLATHSYYQLLQTTRISTLYHRRRQAFFENWEMASKALALILGSGAAASIFKGSPDWVSAGLAFLVTITSAISLVVGTSRKATLHSSLAQRWLALESELIASRQREGALEVIEAKIPLIEQEEPPTLSGLVRLCTREVLRAEGHAESELPQIPWRQRLFANFIDFQAPI